MTALGADFKRMLDLFMPGLIIRLVTVITPHPVFRIVTLVVLSTVGVLIASTGSPVCFGQTDESEMLIAEKILNDGVIQEVIYGDLEEAEDLYLSVVTRFGRFRRIAAQALLRLAGCKEKGKAFVEARDLYDRVIREYAEIQDLVLIAQSYRDYLQPLYPFSEITIISPNGGELFDWNNNIDIKWYGGTEGGRVKIELLKDGVHYLSIHENADNSGTYHWLVLTSDPEVGGDDFQIRITDLDHPESRGESDAPFSIHVLEIIEPDPDDIYAIGESMYIRWTNGYWLNSVKIELLRRGVVVRSICERSDDLGKCSWVIPDDCLPGYDYQIRVTNLTWHVSKTSKGYFTITP